MNYRIHHLTEYHYAEPMTQSYNLAHMTPRHMPGQRLLHTEMEIHPQPNDCRECTDYFGNPAAYFSVQTRHSRLAVQATSEVEVDDASGPELDLFAPVTVGQARLQPQSLEVSEMCLDSPMVQTSATLANYAATELAPERPLIEAVAGLVARIYQDFAYQPGVTTVSTPLHEVFAQRRGVCQDFAHLAIGCLRSHGLAARYVSGYLETQPPPGEERLVGVDASHAWLAVYVPPVGWIDFDPTNNQRARAGYITTAWGRDYGDVTPLKGVVFGRADTQQLKVAVHVERLETGP